MTRDRSGCGGPVYFRRGAKAAPLLFTACLVLLSLVSVSCVSETNYYSETGTLSIPFGAKEGRRNPEEAYPPYPAEP